MIKNFIIILTLLYLHGINAQDDSLRNISIKYYGFDISVSSDPKSFFTGVLIVSKNNDELFRMDSVFSDYIEHSFADLNGDSSNELLLTLSEGASPYVFHTLYIFDYKKGAKPLFTVQNGYLDTASGVLPRIFVNARMSPSFMGLWYYWFLEYKNNRLVYREPDKINRKKLRPDTEGILENMKEVAREDNYCSDFIYPAFFENVFICYKLSGEEYKAEEFFKENYSCPDRIAALKSFKEYASNTFSWIKDEKNYLFSEY